MCNEALNGRGGLDVYLGGGGGGGGGGDDPKTYMSVHLYRSAYAYIEYLRDSVGRVI